MDKTEMKPDTVTPDLLQALRNVTRAYMELRAKTSERSIDSTRSIVCVSESLRQLERYSYKMDRPL